MGRIKGREIGISLSLMRVNHPSPSKGTSSTVAVIKAGSRVILIKQIHLIPKKMMMLCLLT